MPRLLEVFLRFLRLGVSAFGGPIAHLGYFEREFVERAKWLEREAYAEIVALCTVLPGPTSSQVGMLLGAKRAGPLGAIAAWLAFTFPSALFMGVVGTYAYAIDDRPAKGIGNAPGPPGLDAFLAFVTRHPAADAALGAATETLGAMAFAVVLLAVINLGRSILVTPFARATAPVAFLISITTLEYAPSFSWIALAIGAMLGARFAPSRPIANGTPFAFSVPARVGVASLAILALLLFVFPAFATAGYGELFATTFRAGSLVFGGGHVVLALLAPMMNVRIVFPGIFQFGYGVVQIVPGPLFTFASFLGAADSAIPNKTLGAVLATLGIFLPSFFILPAALALWSRVRDAPRASAILAGLGAAVVGLLAATFLDLFLPDVWARSAIGFSILVAIAFALLARARWPAWSVALTLAIVSSAYSALAVAAHFPAYLRLG